MYKIREMSPGEIADILPTVDKSGVEDAINYAEKHDISVGSNSKRVISKS